VTTKVSSPGPIRGYRNPVLRGVHADPSIARFGDDYVLVTSSMDLSPGLPVHRSRDLLHWELVGHALGDPPGEPGPTRMIYAPTVRTIGGRLYVVSTDVAGGGNFLVSADRPEGPWSDPTPIDPDVFDPSLTATASGTVYYTRRGPFDAKDIVQAEIDLATGELNSPLRSIASGFVSDDAEGPHLYEIDGLYYLLLAEGGSRALHMVTVGRSESPWGPFEPCPWNPILAQHHAWWHEILGAGHGDLLQAADGSWWLVFLATRHPAYDALSHIGRETFLAPVTWRDGWPVIEANCARRLEVDAPTLPVRPTSPPLARDDFDSPVLSGEWVSVTLPEAGRGGAGYPRGGWTLTARPSFLRIFGRVRPAPPGSLPPGSSVGDAPLDATAEPSSTMATFIGRRQADLHCRFAARIDCDLAPGDEAGAGVFQTAAYRYEIVLSRAEPGSLIARLRRHVGDLHVDGPAVSLPTTAVVLQVSADPERYHFAVRPADGPPDGWRDLGSGLTRLISSEVAQAWSGALLGVFAARARPESPPVDVDWADYLGFDPPVVDLPGEPGSDG
jgi:xylan 1,4-beta-xylosidase